MAKKKVKEVTGVYNPFWTKETMETFGGNVRSFANRVSSSLMEYKCDTHLPFYSLPKINPRYLNTIHYLLLNTDGVAVPACFNSIREADIRTLMTNLWRNERYEQFMLAMDHKQQTSFATVESIVKAVKGTWDQTMRASVNATLEIPDTPSCTGALNIIKCMKMGTHIGLGNIHSKAVRSGPWAHPKYLFGRYFLAHLVDIAANGGQVFEHGGASHETLFAPVPLMSLMYKVEHVNLVRAYLLNNKEMPAELMELWVDESLDKLDSPHPVRLQYVRSVKKPFEEAGVTIKVVPNLDSLMFERMVVPSFKSLKAQKDWIVNATSLLMDKERVSNGIATKKQEIDRKLGSIFDLVSSGFGEVMRGPDGTFIAGVQKVPTELKKEYTSVFDML